MMNMVFPYEMNRVMLACSDMALEEVYQLSTTPLHTKSGFNNPRVTYLLVRCCLVLRLAGYNPKMEFACESGLDTSPASSSSIQDASTSRSMAPGASWGVLTEVGGHWHSVSS